MEDDPIEQSLHAGVNHVRAALSGAQDMGLFQALRLELKQVEADQRLREQQGLVQVERLDDSAEKCWTTGSAMPVHNSVLRKMEETLDVQGLAWGSNLFEDASVPFDFHRDGITHGTGDNTQLQANVSVIGSFGGERELTFVHCNSGRHFSYLLQNGDVLTFNRSVDDEFTHGLHPCCRTGMERISVVMFSWTRESNQQALAAQRQPFVRVVSMSRPVTPEPRLVQFTGVFVSEEHLKMNVQDLQLARRRTSLLSAHSLQDLQAPGQNLEGRIASLSTRSKMLGLLECLLLEPRSHNQTESQSGSDSCDTLAVAVCFQGLPLSSASLQEWSMTARRAGWLDLGITVAVPNCQMSSALDADDIEAVIGAVLEHTMGRRRYILVAKDEGARLCIQHAALERNSPLLAGILLAAPASPAPAVCKELLVPVLLCWAQDDSVTPIEDLQDWLEVLDGRRAPTSVQKSVDGGHCMHEILSRDGVARAVRGFTAAALILAELPAQVRTQSSFYVHCSKLVAELPAFLQHLASTRVMTKEACRQLQLGIRSWIQADMVMISASE